MFEPAGQLPHRIEELDSEDPAVGSHIDDELDAGSYVNVSPTTTKGGWSQLEIN